MKTGLADFLLSLVVDGGGAVGGLARKGLGVLRALLGGVPGRLGALLKRALAFVTSKLSTGASVAREKIGGALASLKRRAEAVLRGEASEPEPEAEPAQDDAAASSCAAAASSSSCAAASSSPAPASTTAASEAETSGDDGTPRAPLSTLAPLLGRALVRALQRPRAGMRSGRASPLVLGAT